MVLAALKDKMFKLLVGILLLSISLFGQTTSARINLANIDHLENQVIHDRLQRILTYQYSAWRNCKNPSPQTIAKLNSWYSIITDDSIADKTDTKEEVAALLRTITAIRQTQSPSADCPTSFRLQQTQSVRQEMTRPPALKRDIYRFYKELAPACFPVASKGKLKNKDTNACFGGDRMITQDMQKLELQLPYDSLIFATDLFQSIQTLKMNQNLDLFNVFARRYKPDPKAFFTLLASFATSGNSGLTGWLQGVEDTLLVNDLNDSSLDENAVFRRTKTLQKAKLTYQKFRELADARPKQVFIFGNNFQTWNRHNVMAAYLGCRESGNQDEVLGKVTRIGKGYEAKDFISHILEGVSIKTSIQNFKEDTQRYTEGAILGHQACHPGTAP